MSDVEKLILEEIEATKRIEEAKKKADEIIAKAHEEAKRILDEKNIEERLRKYIEEQEEIIKSEAKKIKESYLDKASKIRSISGDKIKEAVEAVLKEVLRVE
ncbi:MAG: V-type ATP synthase subunit H [Candidatus Odinarchaeota archaeon]|nr:V-type ATP synthase subunit H [Candidatus Odinarchaeota archaeon]